MSISITCVCGKQLRVADELAGRRGKCPACRAEIQIPHAAPAALEARAPQLQASSQPVTAAVAGADYGAPAEGQLAVAAAQAGASPFRQGYTPGPVPVWAPSGQMANPFAPSAYLGQAGFDPSLSAAHQLSSFPVPLLLVLNFVTINIFVTIWLLLMHGKMPKLRHDDPSAAKAIGFCFIPFFNLFYWSFFVYHRLVTRLNEQRTLRGLPPANLHAFAITLCALLIVTIVPFIGIPFSVLTGLILFPIFASLLQTSVNELVEVTAAGKVSPSAVRRICLRHTRIFRLTWGIFLGVIGSLLALLFIATYIHGLVGETEEPMPLLGLVVAFVLFALPFLVPAGILVWLAGKAKIQMTALAV